MNVLLLGNYPNDGQESMRRFSDLLSLQLADHGIQTQCLGPSSVFGRLYPSASGVGKWLGYLDKFLLFPGKLRKRVRQLNSELVVHICDHSNAVYTRFLGDVPHLVTCHDLLAVRSALGEFSACRTRASGRLYQKLILRGLNAAQRVACVSTATCRDLLRLSKLAPRQVATIHNGLNYPYAPLREPEAANRLHDLAKRLTSSAAGKLGSGFILHVGGNQWYKNRIGVVQIYARLRDKMSSPPNLVMVGKPLTPQLRRSISKHRLEDHIIELNAVSNEDLRTLYCCTGLLLFPSSEEGFGWPIVEAQACGCPVVVARREPMTEIGGDSGVYFDFESDTVHEDAPLSRRSADNAASAVKQTILEIPEVRKSRVERGVCNAARFSTARMVEDYMDQYRQLLKGASKFNAGQEN